MRRTAAAAGIDLGAAVTPASASAAYTYRIAPMDVNTAQATVTAAGRLTATRAGQVRVTVTVTDGAWTGTRSALIDVRLANAAALA
ncbi:MAG: hypothetical protein LBT54_00535, partial [Bifidobacteriaceae bacterium]|nr:hypothetical protein [Bifidobacteriaceae bacterium]